MLGGEYHHLRHSAPHIGHSHILLACPQPKLEGLPYQSTDVEHEDAPGIAGAGSIQVTLPAQYLPSWLSPTTSMWLTLSTASSKMFPPPWSRTAYQLSLYEEECLESPTASLWSSSPATLHAGRGHSHPSWTHRAAAGRSDLKLNEMLFDFCNKTYVTIWGWQRIYW